MSDVSKNKHIFPILQESLIDLNVRTETKTELIHVMADMLYNQQLIGDKEIFIRDVFIREQEGGTAIGFGVALPHGMSETVRHSSIVICRTINGIKWDEQSCQLINIAILLALKATEEDIETMEQIKQFVSKLAEESTLKALQSVESKKECYKILYNKSSKLDIY